MPTSQTPEQALAATIQGARASWKWKSRSLRMNILTSLLSDITSATSNILKQQLAIDSAKIDVSMAQIGINAATLAQAKADNPGDTNTVKTAINAAIKTSCNSNTPLYNQIKTSKESIVSLNTDLLYVTAIGSGLTALINGISQGMEYYSSTKVSSDILINYLNGLATNGKIDFNGLKEALEEAPSDSELDAWELMNAPSGTNPNAKPYTPSPKNGNAS